MDPTLPYRGWVLTFGIILSVLGVTALSSPAIQGVENVLSDDDIRLAVCAGFCFLGTGLAVIGLTENDPAARILKAFGTIIASLGVVMAAHTLLYHFGILS